MTPDLLSNIVFGVFMAIVSLFTIFQARHRNATEAADDVEMQMGLSQTPTEASQDEAVVEDADGQDADVAEI